METRHYKLAQGACSNVLCAVVLVLLFSVDTRGVVEALSLPQTDCLGVGAISSNNVFSPVVSGGDGSLVSQCMYCEALLCDCVGGILSLTPLNTSTQNPLAKFCESPDPNSACSASCLANYTRCKANYLAWFGTSTGTTTPCSAWALAFHNAQLAAAVALNYNASSLYTSCAQMACGLVNASCPASTSAEPNYISSACNETALRIILPTTPVPTTPIPTTPAPSLPTLNSNSITVAINSTLLLAWLRSTTTLGIPGNATALDVAFNVAVTNLVGSMFKDYLELWGTFQNADPDATTTTLSNAVLVGQVGPSITPYWSLRVSVNATGYQRPSGFADSWAPVTYLVSIDELFFNGTRIPSVEAAQALLQIINTAAMRPAFMTTMGILSAGTSSTAFPPLEIPAFAAAQSLWGTPRLLIGLAPTQDNGLDLWVFIVVFGVSVVAGILTGFIVARFFLRPPPGPTLRERLLQEPVLQRDPDLI
jgi:hypothetical protein